MMFDARLRLCGASPLGTLWLQRAGAEAQIAELVRAFRAGKRTSAVVRVGSAEARVTRLAAKESVRYLVHLPLEAELSENERLLSPTQLQIARRAASGATLKEIARALGRSPETVRSHLREVYRRFEVSSRIELANALISKE